MLPEEVEHKVEVCWGESVAVGLLFEGTASFRVICFIFGEGVGKDWGERLGTGDDLMGWLGC